MNTYERTTQESKLLAETILQQLGGRRFMAMTGSKNFLFGSNFLTFRVGSGAKFEGRTVNFVVVSLEDDDTYTVSVKNCRGMKTSLVKKVSGVYCDNLQEVFTSLTGLYISL